MNLGLDRKIALVTASSQGLGFAAARELVREGACVMLNSHNQANLDNALASLRQEFGDSAPIAAFSADLTNAADCAALVEATVAKFGGLDILITNNGGPPKGTFESTTLAEYESGLQLTLLSVVYLLKAALPYLKASTAATVLTVTSISAKEPIAGLHLSNVIRPAVVGLTKAIAQELGPSGIRANSILPGWTATDRVEYILGNRAKANGTTLEEEAAKITTGVPLGRMAEPAEFGRVVAFMVSPAASYLNGAMLQLDGGAYSGLL
jgi:3-oxoacyl-[acyl-carrier protein] reductase